MDSDFSRACGRTEELMGFLYGELNEIEASAFRVHVKDCSTCSSELSSFGNIRNSVVAWRDESFSSLSLPRVNVPVHNRSAVAAIREFFNLSPAWMKVAVGFASLLFCVFAVLAVFGLRQSNEPVIVNNELQPAAEQIDRLVKQRVEEELKRLKNSSNLTASGVQPPVNKERSSRKPVRPTVRYANDARRPLTRVEREQLAADLRLTSSVNDSEVELLSDTINQ